MDRHWVGIQCEAGEASKAKPTVAEASEDHAHVRFNHFNHALLVAVQCEVSGASEATPAVAEVSEASGSYLYIIRFLTVRVSVRPCVRFNVKTTWFWTSFIA